MRFLDKFQEYVEVNSNIENVEILNKDKNNSLNEASIVEKPLFNQAQFIELINKIDTLFKDNNIKTKLKIYTSFGVEYILAKQYSNVSSILSDNNIKFINRNDKNIFIIN